MSVRTTAATPGAAKEAKSPNEEISLAKQTGGDLRSQGRKLYIEVRESSKPNPHLTFGMTRLPNHTAP